MRIKDKEAVMLVVFFGFLLLLAPILLRVASGNHALITDQAYYHIRAAENLMLGNFYDYNMDRLFFITPYHYLLAGLGFLMPLTAVSIMLPILLGIASLAIFYRIIMLLFEERLAVIFILVALVASPAFVYAFTISSPTCLAIFLMLLAFYSYMLDTKMSRACCAVCLGILSLFGVFYLLLGFMSVLSYTLVKKKKERFFFGYFALMLVISLIINEHFFVQFTAPSARFYLSLVSDLGSSQGFGIFNLALALVGLVLSWKRKNKLLSIYLGIIMLLFLSSKYLDALLYANFLVAVLGGIGLYELFALKWSSETTKMLTVLIIICGLIFSLTSYTKRVVAMEPSTEDTLAAKWIEQNPIDGVVLGQASGSYLFEGSSEVYLDDLSVYSKNYGRRLQLYNEILYSNDLTLTRSHLADTGIKYIVITRRMREATWDKETGLLYLLRNNETFIKKYSTEDVMIIGVLS